LTKEGNVKIADFGIARTQHGHKLTEHGGVVGTIDYVAPEYMLRSQVDWRSDIYALGVLAFEMIAGEPPFRGDSVYATMTKRLKTDPDPPSKLRPDCPQELDRVILKAMQREPQDRYQAAIEIFFDLQRIASDKGMPSAFAGGVFLPNHVSAGGVSYVGPTLKGNSDGDAEVSKSSEVPSQGVAQASTTTSSVAVRGSGATLGGVPVKSGRGGTAAGQVQAPESNHSSTHVLHDNLVDHAVDSASRPAASQIRLESVLRPENNLAAEQWSKSDEKSISGGVISDRVRDLSSKYHQQNTRLVNWGDAMALLVAAVIGVAFGFMMLKLFLPSVLSDVQF
jgi:serine/threonine protein kinase